MEFEASYFDEIYQAIYQSPTYKQFCNQIYGSDLLQYNMLTKKQLSKLESCFGTTDCFIDMGCGVGEITAYLTEKYSIQGWGIDYSQKAIDFAVNKFRGNKNLVFNQSDISEPKITKQSVDTVLSIDTLYFVKDMKLTLSKWAELCKPKKSQMLIFYSERVESGEESTLEPDSTRLAQNLTALKLPYKYLEFSIDEKSLWMFAKDEMERLKPTLEAEGNLAVYKGWKSAIDNVCPAYEKGLQRRYFYTVSL